MKKCSKCKELKSLTEFHKRRSGVNKGYPYSMCKPCQVKAHQEYRKSRPWYVSYEKAKTRCNNPHNNKYSRYGSRGIKFLLTFADAKYLWDRDSGEKLNRASIDRINSDGDYTLQNCRFIELSENSRLGVVKRHKLLKHNLAEKEE